MKTKSIAHLILFVLLYLSSSPFYAQSASEETGIDKKVESLLSQMTLDEKIGQMCQVDYYALRYHLDYISKYSLGSILCGGDTEPDNITAQGWSDVHDKFQSYALNSRLKIPIIWGVDAVHGNNNVNGATIFPHNIGLGAARNPALVEKIGKITAQEMKAAGLEWNFAPCIAVSLDERWGRTYESYGEDPLLVAELGAAYVKGLQGEELTPNSVLACAKHFVGDGGTTFGRDQGDTDCSEEFLRNVHLPGYVEAVKAGVKSVMVSYSSWNGLKMHANKYLITDVLKNELKFEGIVISDWGAIDQLGKDYKKDVELSINAGLDMIMLPRAVGRGNSFVEFIRDLKELVEEGKVNIDRIDDAVRRILRVKFQLGVFDNPYSNNENLKTFGSKEHREVARDAVRQSLVLLKNKNNLLPLSKEIKKLAVGGKAADDIGLQCGGWTIAWQGGSGNVIFGGTTILNAIQNTVSRSTEIVHSPDCTNIEDAEACIVAVSELPYAEGKGDRKDLGLYKEDLDVIKNAEASGVPVIVILISGRPMIITDQLNSCDSFIAAWLPGTEGQGVADVLFGDYKPSGKLSVSWPKNIEQIPVNIGDKNYDPLFPYGFGLTY